MDINTRQEVYDNLVTSTWYDIRRTLIDQVFLITPFYDMMVKNGRIKERVPDGTHFEIPIRYAKMDQNTQWFGRGAKFGRQEKETLTRLYYQTKNLGTSIVRFWDDDRKNRGKAQILNYVNEVVENTRLSLEDGLATDVLIQNGDSQAITSLDTLVTTTPTSGSVGGLDRSTNAYLQNKATDLSSGFTFATDLIDNMRTMFNNCSKQKFGGRRTPDMILTSQAIYEGYQGIAEALRIIDTNTNPRVSLGFGNMAFNGVEMYWDPDLEGSGKIYFLNTSSLELAYDPGAWFEMTAWKSDADGLDRTAQVVSVCELICTQFLKQGVLYGIDESAI